MAERIGRRAFVVKDEAAAKKAVVIGAGQTGRGYAARLLTEIGYEIVFIDQNAAVIERLNEDGQFSVHFYDRDRTPLIVSGYKALTCDDMRTEWAIASADYIFTAVGEQNLGAVAILMAKALAHKEKPTVLMTCENGIHPARILTEFLEKLGVPQAHLSISQTAVFCSTVHIVETRLDLLSQNENYFPYDADALTSLLEIKGAVPVHHFEHFLKRKIYTYNCLAGLISYVGYLKGYTLYGDAANDAEISGLMDDLLRQLNPALAKYFSITLSEQISFAEKALHKFKNKNILDYVIKNGRAPGRKLGPTERIIAPLVLIEANGGNADLLYFNAAAALCYWEEQIDAGREPKVSGTVIEELCTILHKQRTDPFMVKVRGYWDYIRDNRGSLQIRRLIAGKV